MLPHSSICFLVDSCEVQYVIGDFRAILAKEDFGV